MDFQISPLPLNRFSHLFEHDDDALAAIGIRRSVADNNPGYPCRVSLQDAEVGESVLLVNFEHQPAPTPFRSSHAIYVREAATQAAPVINEIPPMLRSRLLSIRAFDTNGMLLAGEVIDGHDLETPLTRMLSGEAVDSVHIHNALLGCYLAVATRI